MPRYKNETACRYSRKDFTGNPLKYDKITSDEPIITYVTNTMYSTCHNLCLLNKGESVCLLVRITKTTGAYAEMRKNLKISNNQQTRQNKGLQTECALDF